ncbi:hypothetical protein CY652_21825 [Burkholderia sp. WAC0059]|uniref:hypothetical protein n=1 Tax=Burkholderia sp. WAC0059 TaxID=2066022 RepID=UPI000C7F269B|nr:hypothetical protein [Burkholderia sp. WAC0059]PLZ00284.1 hypothetical protein CY652_21825 [Burkholderia sp. WAC0059]
MNRIRSNQGPQGAESLQEQQHVEHARNEATHQAGHTHKTRQHKVTFYRKKTRFAHARKTGGGNKSSHLLKSLKPRTHGADSHAKTGKAPAKHAGEGDEHGRRVKRFEGDGRQQHGRGGRGDHEDEHESPRQKLSARPGKPGKSQPVPDGLQALAAQFADDPAKLERSVFEQWAKLATEIARKLPGDPAMPVTTAVLGNTLDLLQTRQHFKLLNPVDEDGLERVRARLVEAFPNGIPHPDGGKPDPRAQRFNLLLPLLVLIGTRPARLSQLGGSIARVGSLYRARGASKTAGASWPAVSVRAKADDSKAG